MANTFPRATPAEIAAGKAIAAALMQNAVLTTLDTRGNNIIGEAAQQLAAAVVSSKSLKVFSEVPIEELRDDKHTSRDLSSKDLGPTEGIVLAELIKGTSVLTTLNLSGNEIDPEGGAAIAKALEVNEVMKKCDLRYNRLGEAEKQMVRDAVKGRESFELDL